MSSSGSYGDRPGKTQTGSSPSRRQPLEQPKGAIDAACRPKIWEVTPEAGSVSLSQRLLRTGGGRGNRRAVRRRVTERAEERAEHGVVLECVAPGSNEHLDLIRLQLEARLDGVDFTARVAAALEDMVRRRGVPALVIVAPPRTLADLRTAFHADVKKRIVAEVGKDLTKHPVADIEKHLFARRA
jgi:hypothetical protein